MSILTTQGDIKDPYRSFIAKSRYSRWLDDENRRETWLETVTRYVNFMRETEAGKKIHSEEWTEIHKAILNHEVMPSMRGLMTAGPALARDNVALFNCSFIAIDDVRAFDEALYILMNGVGLGFSVELQYVAQLPTVNEHFEHSDTTIVVEDSKAGWARAFRELLAMLYAGQIPAIDITKVRPAGARLKTFGGRSSGPQPLVDLFDFAIGTFKDAAGRKLTPIECHDLMCKVGDVVVVGGVRRCLPDDAIVSTPTGPKRMVDVVVGDMVVSGGRKARVAAKVDSGKQQTVIVKHRFGQSEMTPNHRIAVFDSADTYIFKEAGSLEIGDRIVWDLAGYDGEIQSLPAPSYMGHFNAKSFVVPEVLDTDTAWLIGLVHGDGHIHAKGIEISGHYDEWATLERANAIFADKFGVTGTVARDSHDGNGIRLRVNSTGLALWFAENVKTPSESIRVPGFINSAQRDVRSAYLAGVLDSDGRVRDDGVMEQVTTIYSEFATDLMSLLRGLGIAATNAFSSAQRRRDLGENAQDFWTVKIAGNTSRNIWLDTVGAFSEKANGIHVSDGLSPHDFTYPAEWGLAYRNRATQRTTLVKRGELPTDYPFAPVEVLSVELGSVQQTWDIEVEDIHEFTADGLVTHNSALISQSDLYDYEMSKAKSGAWWDTTGYRRLANNSAVYYKKPSVGEFLTEWGSLYESKSGERGIINMEGLRTSGLAPRRDLGQIQGLNPCAEILLRSKQFCNLTEVIVRDGDTKKELARKVRLATILGTVQSSLTNFKYLRKIWRDNCEEERLLGVSLTGQFGHSVLSGGRGLDSLASWLDSLKATAIETNAEFAALLGINVSTAITTVKPSGTVSQLTASSSGMHPWHSNFYFRTVRADNKDPMTQFMKDFGVPHEPDVMAPDTTTVFAFPIAAPKDAITRHDLTAVEHLEIWKTYKTHWTEHNPSVTINVDEHEWIEVANWVYENWDFIGGISFLPKDTGSYKQAPYQDATETDYRQFMAEMPKSIDWSWLSDYEHEDTTTGSQTLACTASNCEIVSIGATVEPVNVETLDFASV